MIAHLRGKLLAKHPNQAIVETAGVGYDVTISVPTFSDLPAAGAEVALHIYTHVREDLIALYGFLRPSGSAWCWSCGISCPKLDRLQLQPFLR